MNKKVKTNTNMQIQFDKLLRFTKNFKKAKKM